MFKSKPKDVGYLSDNEMALIEINRSLSEEDQKLLLSYAKGMEKA